MISRHIPSRRRLRALCQEGCMIVQTVRRLRGIGRWRQPMAFKALFVVALAAAGFFGFAQPSYAAAVPPDMADECESLAQGATASRTDQTPMPFDAAQI